MVNIIFRWGYKPTLIIGGNPSCPAAANRSHWCHSPVTETHVAAPHTLGREGDEDLGARILGKVPRFFSLANRI